MPLAIQLWQSWFIEQWSEWHVYLNDCFCEVDVSRLYWYHIPCVLFVFFCIVKVNQAMQYMFSPKFQCVHCIKVSARETPCVCLRLYQIHTIVERKIKTADMIKITKRTQENCKLRKSYIYRMRGNMIMKTWCIWLYSYVCKQLSFQFMNDAVE